MRRRDLLHGLLASTTLALPTIACTRQRYLITGDAAEHISWSRVDDPRRWNAWEVDATRLDIADDGLPLYSTAHP